MEIEKHNKKVGLDFNNETEVNKFISLINNPSIPYKQIALEFGYESTTAIYSLIKALKLKMPDRETHRSELYSKHSNNESVTKALAPLKYSPTVRIIRCGTRNNIHYYVPELDRLVTGYSLESVLNRKGIKLYEWECRWFLGLDTSLISTDLWADSVISYFYNDKKYNTKQFIKSNLLSDPGFKFKDLMIKKDLLEDIKLACNTNPNLKDVLNNLDINSLPESIKNISESFEIKDKSGKIFSTSYFKFIVRGVNPFNISPRRKTLEEFKKDSVNKFGEGKFEILSDYLGRDADIMIKCNTCGSIFKTTPSQHLSSPTGNCINCNNINTANARSFTTKEFQDRIDSIYGIGNYKCVSEYKNMKTNVFILETSTGKIFEQDPENILYHSIVNPEKYKKSNGEKLTELWLTNNNLTFKNNVKNFDIEGRSVGSYVIIDFILEVNNNTFWIEYNGKQHYVYSSRFSNFDPAEFKRQKTRDINVRNYCINNNICLIEIPFILSSYKSISIFLTKVIFDGVDPNSIIDYEKIYNGESTIKSIDLMNIF